MSNVELTYPDVPTSSAPQLANRLTKVYSMVYSLSSAAAAENSVHGQIAKVV